MLKVVSPFNQTKNNEPQFQVVKSVSFYGYDIFKNQEDHTEKIGTAMVIANTQTILIHLHNSMRTVIEIPRSSWISDTEKVRQTMESLTQLLG